MGILRLKWQAQLFSENQAIAWQVSGPKFDTFLIATTKIGHWTWVSEWAEQKLKTRLYKTQVLIQDHLWLNYLKLTQWKTKGETSTLK